MVRKLRVHAPGALYHVTLRGNHQQSIFRTPMDQARFDEIVAESLERHSARLHAYCWMSNHLHMLVQVHLDPLGKVMHRIASRYARYAQREAETTGHFFERRYHAIVVDRDSYLLELVRYIHLNPVRAGLCLDPSQYPWSSHCVYLGTAPRPWVTTEPTLRLFGASLPAARKRYAHFISAALQSNWPDHVPTPDPGGSAAPTPDSGHFAALGGSTFMVHVPQASRPPRAAVALEQLALQVCREAGVSLDVVRSLSRSRRISVVRADILQRALDLGVCSATEVARFLNRSLSAICRLSERYCK